MAKQGAAKNAKQGTYTNDFVVVKRGSDVYVNGNKILVPDGRGSVSRKTMRDAARKVAAERK